MPKQELPVLTTCCTPISEAALDPVQAADGAAVFKALSDPIRLRLMSLIASAGDEVCVCDITPHFEVSGPTISHHLKVLREAGLVESSRRGTWAYYRLVPEALDALRGALAA